MPSGSESPATRLPAAANLPRPASRRPRALPAGARAAARGRAAGTSCSTSARMPDVAQTVWVIPSRSKCCWFLGSLTRAIAFGTPYPSFAIWAMTRLSSSSPVTASTMSGGRSIPARSSTWISVASPRRTTGPNSSSSCSKRSWRCSTSVTSWPISSSEAATFDPTLPPPATTMYIRPAPCAGRAGARLGCTHGVDEERDRRLGGAHRAQAEPREELGAPRVEHADDDALDAVALLDHLADHDVGVVAVRRDDRGVGGLDAGLHEDIHLHGVADDERALPVAAESRKRLLVLVDGGDVPAVAGELLRNRRPTRPHPMTRPSS